MSRRKTTDDEKTLFQKTIDTAQPFKAATPKPKAKKPAITRAAAAKILDGHRIDGHTGEKLKRGARAPQLRIDLHGMTQIKAHAHLLAALRRGQKEGVRLALVITGVGNPKRDEDAAWMAPKHGVLKQMVPRWLQESEFAALVTGSGAAHLRHGGDGALYVTLRKTPSDRAR